MKKRIIVAATLTAMLSVGTAFAREEEEQEKNAEATSSASLVSFLKNVTLAPGKTSVAEKSTDEAKSQISGHISVWQRFLTTDRVDLPLNISGFSGGRAGEYSSVGSSPGAGFGMTGIFDDKSAFDLVGAFEDKDEGYLRSGVDLGRIVRSETSVNRFIHRLEHDPLTNVEFGAVDSEGTALDEEFVFDDQNPEDIYSTTLTEAVNKTDLVIPALPNLKIRSKVRYRHENGLQQARTLDNCLGCHLVGQSQVINQTTRDFTVGADLTAKGVALSYAHLGRRFDNEGKANFHEYTDPFHRFLYSGRLEFAHIPDSEKRADTVKAKIDALKSASLFGSYTIARVRNKNNDGEADIKNLLSRLRAVFGKRLHVTLKFLNNKYENLMDPDFLFEPKNQIIAADHLSKDSYTVGASALYRIPGKKTSFRVGVDYNNLKRNFSFSSQTEAEEREVIEKFLEETKTTTFNAGVRFNPGSKVNGFVRYKLKDVDRPFGLPVAAEENPIDPGSERFLSSLYEKVNLLSAGLTYMPKSQVALTANYYYNSSTNDTIDSSQRLDNLVFSLWYGVSERASLTTSYTYMNDDIVNTLIFGTPVGWPFVREDKNVPYNRKANVFLVAFDLHPSEEFSIFGDFSVTDGESNWKNKDLIEGRVTSDIADLSNQDLTHTRATAGARYAFLENMSLFGKWMYENYDDKAFPLYADSGKFSIVYFGFGYKF